jgi:DNA topoisomerase-6 subunit A
MSEKKENDVIKKLKALGESVYKKIMKLEQPELTMPLRDLSNITYDEKEGFFDLKGKTKSRTLTASTIKTFAQTIKMMNLSKKLVETNDIATKRDAYYQSKGAWGPAAFQEQEESDAIMDDVEATMGVNREQIGFIPDEHGDSIAGNLIVIDKDSETGEKIEIDCSRMGSGGWSVPSSVERLQFKTTAKFVLAIETSGTFQRLNYHKFWKKYNCVLASLKGVPSRSIRRLLRRLSDEHHLPVYVFTDGDPYGYFSIYRTLKVGSGNAAHINKYFCVPKAKYIGVTPQDIIDYKLPTHPLKDVDLKKIKDVIKNDPFLKAHKEWQKALNDMVKMGKRVEQQAFSAHSLNYVMDTYLPKKLKDEKSWLP